MFHLLPAFAFPAVIMWLGFDPGFKPLLAFLGCQSVFLSINNRKKDEPQIQYQGTKRLIYEDHGVSIFQGKPVSTREGIRFDYLEIAAAPLAGSAFQSVQRLKYERVDYPSYSRAYISGRDGAEFTDRDIKSVQAFSVENAVFIYRLDGMAENFGFTDRSKAGTIFELAATYTRPGRASEWWGNATLAELACPFQASASDRRDARVEMKVGSQAKTVMEGLSVEQAVVVVEKFLDWTARNNATAAWCGRFNYAFEHLVEADPFA